MLLLKTSPRLDPSVALNELAEVIGETYIKGQFDDNEFKFNHCLDPKETIAPILKAAVDDFAEDKEKMWKIRQCAGEYAAIVKERTEKMFPVSLFKGFCNEAQKTPTGL